MTSTYRDEASTPGASYALGSDDAELARLDAQAAWLAGPTRLLLRAAGVAPGMRVLDLGTGPGHVARLVAELVGEGGRVVGLDNSPRLLAVAAARCGALRNIRFEEGDARSWRCDETFDAVVGRLILFHMADPAAVVRHHLAALGPGGLVVALDYDVGAARTEPPAPLAAESARRLMAAFRSAGANPVVGTRLGPILAAAGVTEVQTFGIQGYLAPEDPRGPAMLTAVVRSMAPQMERAGIATVAELGLDTLAERLAAEQRAAGAVFLPPVLAGAWGRRP